jgi:hypothetical protein
MKHLHSLSVATLAALCLVGCATSPPAGSPDQERYTIARTSGGPDCRRLAQSGDRKIQIYCSDSHIDAAMRAGSHIATSPQAGETSGDTNCRRVARLTDRRIQIFCGSTSEWEQFDTWAVSAGISCRWPPARGHGQASQELCLNAAQWRILENQSGRYRVVNNDSGLQSAPTQVPGSPSYAVSYGMWGQCCQ